MCVVFRVIYSETVQLKLGDAGDDAARRTSKKKGQLKGGSSGDNQALRLCSAFAVDLDGAGTFDVGLGDLIATVA